MTINLRNKNLQVEKLLRNPLNHKHNTQSSFAKRHPSPPIKPGNLHIYP